MPTLEVNGKSIELDEEGYLLNQDDWNEDVANKLAGNDNCDLSYGHWEIIHVLREYYSKNQIAPGLQVLCKAVGKALEREKGNSKYLLGLFPYGPATQSCRYAGLPKPKSSI